MTFLPSHRKDSGNDTSETLENAQEHRETDSGRPAAGAAGLRPLPPRHDMAKRPAGPYKTEEHAEESPVESRDGLSRVHEEQGFEPSYTDASSAQVLRNGILPLGRPGNSGYPTMDPAAVPLFDIPSKQDKIMVASIPEISFSGPVPGILDSLGSSTPVARYPSGRTSPGQTSEDTNQRSRMPSDSDISAPNDSIWFIMKRLQRSRSKVQDAREEVVFTRNDAVTARSRASKAQEKLLNAQIAAGAERPIRADDRTIQRLTKKAKTAMKEAKEREEEVEKLERRLEGHEFRLEQREATVFDRLKELISLQTPSMLGNFEDLVADDDEDRSSTSTQASSTDYSQPLVRQYHDTVAHISILRERLNEYEISYRERIIAHDEEFEEEYARKRKAITDGFLTEDSVTTYLTEVFTEGRTLLNSYFEERAELAQDLLDSIERGKLIQQQCREEGLDYEDPGEPNANALEEALRYDLDGPVGRMYSVSHEGRHLGVRPLDLVRVPFLHAPERVKHWLLDTATHASQMSSDELAQQVYHITEPRFWIRHQALPATLTAYDEGYGSAYSTHASPFVPVQARNQIRGSKLSEVPPFLWTWSGEWSNDRPNSEPDIIRPNDDHFNEWTKPENHTWD